MIPNFGLIMICVVLSIGIGVAVALYNEKKKNDKDKDWQIPTWQGGLYMNITFIFETILHLIVWGGGIYLYALIVKALKKYINSDKEPKDK